VDAAAKRIELGIADAIRAQLVALPLQSGIEFLGLYARGLGRHVPGRKSAAGLALRYGMRLWNGA
jgi:hypothetical protein